MQQIKQRIEVALAVDTAASARKAASIMRDDSSLRPLVSMIEETLSAHDLQRALLADVRDALKGDVIVIDRNAWSLVQQQINAVSADNQTPAGKTVRHAGNQSSSHSGGRERSSAS